MSELIVHLCQKSDWEAALTQGQYRAASLEQEGFIHCSRPEQVLEVANRYYQGISDMFLLWIDPKQVNSILRWEKSDGDIYPHIYGVLELKAVLGICEFHPDSDGVYRYLPQL